jgi:hypothetical protein
MKRSRRFISHAVVVGGMLAGFAGSPAFGDLYTGWSGHQDFFMNASATGITTNQVKFPVLLRLTSANAAVFSSTTSPADLRFAKGSNLNTGYSYQVQRWDAMHHLAEVWVLVDTIFSTSTSQSFRMYWGNTGAAAASSGPAVFDTLNGFNAVWHLVPPSGTAVGAPGPYTFNDATAHGYSLTSTAGVIDSPTIMGYGPAFNKLVPTGTDSVWYNGLIGSPGNGTNGSAITLSTWVKVDSIDQNTFKTTVMSLGNVATMEIQGETGTSDTLHTAYHASAGDWWSGSSNYHGQPMGQLSASTTPSWIYIAYVVDPNNSNVACYSNGALIEGDNDNVSIGYNVVAGMGPNMAFGINEGNGSRQAFYGTLCEARVDNVGRSGDWLMLSYANQRAGQTFIGMSATPVLAVDGKLVKTGFAASGSTISYSLGTPGAVEVSFNDLLGRTALVLNRAQSSGHYTIDLKRCNLAAGHYIVHFKAPGIDKIASIMIAR